MATGRFLATMMSRRAGGTDSSLFRQGEHSTADLADLFGVARSTVYRALDRDRARGHTSGHLAANSADARG